MVAYVVVFGCSLVAGLALTPLVRLAARALPLFTSDGQHIHHKLLGRGLSRWQAVLIMYAACIVPVEPGSVNSK